MKHDIIIAGVGGQGILTIAKALSLAAVAKGWTVKQAEVHGMSQRGGAVYSHVRISDQEIYSDLIPAGTADMILAVEPLESLRYAPMLRPGGTIIASTNAVVNISDYPAIESVLGKIAEQGSHIAIDMERLARATGGVLASNIVALGAASLFLPFSQRELQDAVESIFSAKGERVVQTNIRALRFGRTAALAYREAVNREVAPAHVRGWIATLSEEHLANEEDLDFSGLAHAQDESILTGAEAHAFESLLMHAYEEGRRQLYEHEVYRLIELVGAITPPRHTFVSKNSTISVETLSQYSGDRVVLKLVSEDVVHKTEAGAVAIIPNDLERVRAEMDAMIERHARHAHVAGVLLVEYVEHDSRGLGSELFVGIRATREFGPVIAAGLGGLQTEYLAAKMRPGIAVAKAPVAEVDAEQFLDLFRQTAAYDVLAGRIRGHDRVVSDAELLRCFRAFLSIAKRFCVDRGATGPDIGELEVNPFAFAGQRLVPLDGRGSLRSAAKSAPSRPRPNIEALLEPDTIGLIGLSAKEGSLSRVILDNILDSGFPRDHMRIVKPDLMEFEGVPCVPNLESLQQPLDMLVITVPARSVPEVIEATVSCGQVRSAIVISGGVGETEGSASLGDAIDDAIRSGRSRPDGGPVFLGPNCMGVRSVPGRYDTFFVPSEKLPPHRGEDCQPIALISQSGAFVVSRLSSQGHLRPRFAISIGNQCDVTVSDLLEMIANREDIKVAGIYLEGFADLDGAATLQAVKRCTTAGKCVVFYKAGRTETGRSAAAGHTAAVAGDYDICQTAMVNAGALVAESFREFNQLVELSASLADRDVSGSRVFAVTNAGMEAVAMADSGMSVAGIERGWHDELAAILVRHCLDGLVEPRNPMDITPQGDEEAYDEIVRSALGNSAVEAVIVSCVPLAPTLHTLPNELDHPGSFPNLARTWLNESQKPIVMAVDGGSEFDTLVQQLQATGVPVFRSSDEAARALSRYLEFRTQHQQA